MTNFEIFTDAHLMAAEQRYADEFASEAAAGRLASASASHHMMTLVREEIGRRIEHVAASATNAA